MHIRRLVRTGSILEESGQFTSGGSSTVIVIVRRDAVESFGGNVAHEFSRHLGDFNPTLDVPVTSSLYEFY